MNYDKEKGTLSATLTYSAAAGDLSVAGAKGLSTNGQDVAFTCADAASYGSTSAGIAGALASDGKGDAAGAFAAGASGIKPIDAGFQAGDPKKADAGAAVKTVENADGSSSAGAAANANAEKAAAASVVSTASSVK